jgi:hypothetical protein
VGLESLEGDEWLKPIENLGILLGLIGIILLDAGFAGSSLTDLFYFGPRLPNVIPPNTVPPVPSNVGKSILGGLPVANSTVFFLGGAFLGLGMIVLIVHNRNRGKLPVSAMPSKQALSS